MQKQKDEQSQSGSKKDNGKGQRKETVTNTAVDGQIQRGGEINSKLMSTKEWEGQRKEAETNKRADTEWEGDGREATVQDRWERTKKGSRNK